MFVTAHQASFTEEAMRNIAATTVRNVTTFERGEPSGNESDSWLIRS